MANNTIKLLQQNIKKYRVAKKFSQAKLAIFAEVSKDYITSIECGRNVPSVKRLILIAKALDVNVKDLFEFE